MDQRSGSGSDDPAACEIPEPWRARVQALLEPGESARAFFEPDLTPDLRYAGDLLVLTDRVLYALHPAAECQRWNIGPGHSLHASAEFQIGSLTLLGLDGPLAVWRFTPRRLAAANAFVRGFNRVRGREPASRPSETNGAEYGSGNSHINGEQADTEGIVAQPLSTLKRLLAFARPRSGMILLGFLLTVASTATGLIPPYLTMPLLDNVLIPAQSGQDVDTRLIYWYMGGLVAAALVAWLLNWARSHVLAWVSERISADLRNQTYSHLQRLSLEFFGGKRTGDLMSRISSDTDRICNFLSVNLLDFATDVLMIAMTAAVLVWINPLLALVTLAPIPIVALVIHLVRGQLRGGYQRGFRAWGRMTSVLADTIPGIRVVKAFAQEQREVQRFESSNDEVLAANDQVNRIWAFFGPTVTLFTEFGLLVIWCVGAWGVFHQHFTVGVLTAFLAYIGRFYGKLQSMSRMVSATQRAGASLQRIFEILDRVPSVPEPAKPRIPGRLRGQIQIRDVGFKYGNRRVLSGLNLAIEQGEMIGLVGMSGAGKSTLVNLICRFYDVLEGSILVDGTDIRSFPVEAYRRNIGIVLQDPFLFYGTIAENIAYGRPEATKAEIIAAARAARAHEFILRLPDGYESLVGERGQLLSGGERQRISIARALLIAPPILILDEATSSIDAQTEQEIQAALDTLTRGRTTIAIAHRLSTLRRAHRLVVLEQGEIVEMGPRAQLLNQPGAYNRLHTAQLEMAEGLAI